MSIFNRIDYEFDHILFINDKEKHLVDVEKKAVAREVAFTGLRYSYCDERIASFNPKLGDYQWKHSTFNHLLSDEEALDGMKKLLLQN